MTVPKPDADIAGQRDPVGVRLSFGPLAVRGRAILAPMAGITDLGMRRLAWRFGASLTVTEMVVGDYLARGDPASLARAAGDGGQPHVVQVAGCTPDSLAEAARIAEGCGAVAIDINMGCPAKRVTGGLAGSALMRDLDHAARLVAATVAAVAVPVSVKMRLGWDEASPQRAGTRPAGRGRGRAPDHGARPHQEPVLSWRGRLARGRGGEAGRRDSRRHQRRLPQHRRREGHAGRFGGPMR